MISLLLSVLQSHISALTVGNLTLFRFYFAHLLKPFRRLPPELYNEHAMSKKMAEGQPFDLVVDRRYVDGYNGSMDKLQGDIKGMWRGPQVDFRIKQILFWLVRLATIAAAFRGAEPLHFTFLVSLLQFLVLPYSLFVALGYGLETVFVLYTGHMFMFPLLTTLTRKCLPKNYNRTITISPLFLALFLLADQSICAACLYKTPKGKTVPLPAGRIWQSVWYGFLNCKSYYLVLLPLCFGFEIPIVPWLLDFTLGISGTITKYTMRYWQVLFYHAHKMGHIPLVYPDAHRFHHHLHDCTAFDAHIFGSGAPEEWLILVADVIMTMFFGIAPASLSPSVLGVSWYNKWGFHTRAQEPAGGDDDGVNFHPAHHSRHVVNYGITYPYDLLMGTTPKEFNGRITWAGYKMRRTEAEDGKTIILQFVPTLEELPSERRQSRSFSGINFSSATMAHK